RAGWVSSGSAFPQRGRGRRARPGRTAAARDDLADPDAERFHVARRRPAADRLHGGGLVGGGEPGAQMRAAKVEGEDPAHPLSPDWIMLLMKARCRAMNRRSGGSTASVAPAITRL